MLDRKGRYPTLTARMSEQKGREPGSCAASGNPPRTEAEPKCCNRRPIDGSSAEQTGPHPTKLP